MRTVEYLPGRSADVVDRPGRPVVLLWHGMQSDARAAVGPLARLIADHDLAVVAPDWDSHADDGGRAALIGSARFAAGLIDGGLVVVGWSLGGVAAAGLTLAADRVGVPIAHTVCLGGAFSAPDPISGGPLADLFAGAGTRVPFTLLHGLGDDVVPADASRDFAGLLGRHGWKCDYVELDTDHAAIAGARYDAAADRYEPAEDTATSGVAGDVAARVAAVAG